MKLPFPGPSDVLHAAEGLRDGVAEALALLPRVVGALSEGEQLLKRVGVLVDRMERIADRAEVAVAGIDVTV